MKLSELITVLPDKQVHGPVDIDIRQVIYDSRQAGPGSLFVAVNGKGYKTDGHAYIGDAVKRGASAVLREDTTARSEAPGTSITVPDTRQALSLVAQNFYGFPAQGLQLVGITGTNGKTSVSYLINAVLQAAGQRTGILGTISYTVGDQTIPASHTTPESLDLQRYLAEMKAARTDTAIMEVSSHSLSMDRLYAMRLDGAVFTNLSHDHLDFHQDLEDYARAKLKMFTELCDQDSAVIVNADDPLSERIREQTPGHVTTYGIRTKADVSVITMELDDQATALALKIPTGQVDLRVKLLGEFNAYNTLAALGTGLALGLDTNTMVRALEAMEPVRGRFESIRSDRGFSVFVDYAHTPDALEKLLASVQKICSGRVIAVFGCGGDRDRGKRPLMGEIATRLARLTIVTSDNPRTEDPQAIIDEILGGITRANGYQVVVDRKEAITRAVSEARKGDMVVIAGKGHEDYQILGTEKIHFDDREIVESLVGLKEAKPE